MEPFTVLQSVRLRESTLEFWSNGIVYFKLDDNVEIQLSDSKTHYEFLK